MTKINNLKNINHNEFAKVVVTCTSKAELHRTLNVAYNGTYVRIVNKLLKDIGCVLKQKLLKYKTIQKICPVCGTTFDDKENHPKSKTTCSHGCANTHFRTGKDHGNYNPYNYRNMCFEHHTKECIICGENRIVDVHHYDGNHEHNIPSNLIPLCPTHHILYHSRFRGDVEPFIEEYYKQYLVREEEFESPSQRPKRRAKPTSATP